MSLTLPRSFLAYSCFVSCLFVYWTGKMDFDPCMDDYELDYALINTYCHTAFGSTYFSCVSP